jgi:hypothetical protein
MQAVVERFVQRDRSRRKPQSIAAHAPLPRSLRPTHQARASHRRNQRRIRQQKKWAVVADGPAASCILHRRGGEDALRRRRAGVEECPSLGRLPR